MTASNLAAGILAALDEQAVAQFAERLRPHLNTEHRLLTATEAADRLGLHPKTVVRMAREGRLPAIKIGTGWRFRPDQLHITPRPRPETTDRVPPVRTLRGAQRERASVRAIRGDQTRRAA